MPQSIDSTRIGTNRTGLQMSPLHSKEMIDNVDAVLTDSTGLELAEIRREYIAEADSLGSVPAPGTLKGVVKSGIDMVTGNRPQAFIDKLAERLAFERGGTRLYDAVLAKFRVHGDELTGVTLLDVQQIRDDEAKHALLIKESIEELGADPTAQTPCADLVGVETSGLLQAATDPRTTLAQTLHAALAAELVDNAGWESLITLAQHLGHHDMAERFGGALAEEREHLAKVSSWYNALTLETGELV